ncbi:MAG TPA: hypothetical protein VNJ53_13500 [Gaiellaceae bacterium]|nr:hypothetical protein [Gaiellaceae bacterium]
MLRNWNATTPALDEAVVIRLRRAGDERALAELAQLESRPLPEGPLVVAELDGSLVAALPLAGREPALADPFRPTRELVGLLEVRRRQLRTGVARRARVALRAPARA